MKIETRRLVSLEHAKTRGYVNLALGNTQALHRRLARLEWVSAFAFILLGSSILALIWFCI